MGGIVAEAWETLTVVERAAVTFDWLGFWARPEQIVDNDPEMASHGCLAGRGFGKTKTHVEFIIGLIVSGEVKRFGFAAQTEDETRRVLIDGPSGFLACSPPWCEAMLEGGEVHWANGAVGIPHTPEKPGKVRGDEYELFYGTELIVWNNAPEMMKNIRYATRQGRALVVWDTTPKKASRNRTLIQKLKARSDANPRRHALTEGSTDDNAANLAETFIAGIEDEYGGTSAEQEERYGKLIEGDDGALFQQTWIDRARRERPKTLARRVIAIDSSTSTRKSTDEFGVADVGLGVDGQAYVFGDHTATMGPEVWTELVLDLYLRGRCDCLVIELNAGGNLLVHALRLAARERGMTVTVVAAGGRVYHDESVVFVRETYAKTSKEARAAAVVPAYEKGRVSHVKGADLEELETQMTTWDPSGKNESGVRGANKSPNNLDALVHGLVEVLGVAVERRDYAKAYTDLGKVAEMISGASPTASAMSLVGLLSGGGRGGGL